ncbi:ABC transporter substrate-binding protein [Rhizobium sp. NPDC090279]|uniref:ABC transporter substrate-binding protein n=1 Tax=Rhizobium sp. NPDC090279 TaxID=3364499 RepID=UPI003839FC58
MKRSLIFAAALAASSLPGIGAQAQDAPVTLTWQMWGQPNDAELWQQLADLVNKQYPDIKVKLQLSGWTDYWTRLPVLAASGQVADIVSMQSMRLPNFYSILTPLDDYVKSSDVKVADFETSIMSGLSQDGKLYALPYDVGPWMVFYNRDKFAAAGLKEPAKDWTFDDFKADAKALTKDGTYGYGTQAFDFIAGPVALGADYFNADNEFDLTNAGFVDAFSKYADLTAKEKLSPVFASAADASAASGRFASGNVAMYIDGPWSLITGQANVNFKIGIAPLPRGAGPSRFITAGSGWGISASSQHKDAAFKALQVLTGPKAAEILGSAGRALPARLAQQTSWYDGAAKNVAGTRDTLEYMFAHTTPFRINEKWNQFENLVMQYVPLALTGDSKPEGVLSDIQSQLP